MDGLSAYKTLTADDVLALLMSIDKQAITASMANTGGVATPTGFKILFAKTPGQAQKALGARRTFSPFAY